MKFLATLLCFCVVLSISAQSVANYNISVTTIWNSTNHSSLPENAHWSPLAGATHKNANEVLQLGVEAPTTNGIKDVAETGNTSNFQAEINTLISSGTANQYLEQEFSPFAGNNSNATLTNVMVSEDFPLITLVAMVAPSPDWFIAVNSENLRSGNAELNHGWKATYTKDVFVYDAGTDSSTDYIHNNTPTVPRAVISKILGYPVNGNKMATITFTYNFSTLSTGKIINSEAIKIFPNPAKDKLTLKNLNSSGINSVKIYNLNGKNLAQFQVPNHIEIFNINLSNFTSGIYLLKLQNKEDSSKIYKLVVQ